MTRTEAKTLRVAITAAFEDFPSSIEHRLEDALDDSSAAQAEISIRVTPEHAVELAEALAKHAEDDQHIAAALDAVPGLFSRSPDEGALVWPEWRQAASGRTWYATRAGGCLQAGYRESGGCWWRVLKGDRGVTLHSGAAPTLEAAKRRAFLAAPRTSHIRVAPLPQVDHPREDLFKLSEETLREISRALGGPTHLSTKPRTLIDGIKERRRTLRILGPDAPSAREGNRRAKEWREQERMAVAARREGYADHLDKQVVALARATRLPVRSAELAASLEEAAETARAAVDRAERELVAAEGRPDAWPTKRERIEKAATRLRIARAKQVLAEAACGQSNSPLANSTRVDGSSVN